MSDRVAVARRFPAVLVGLALAGVVGAPVAGQSSVAAGSPVAAPSEPPPPLASEPTLEIALSPYVWLMGFDGTVGAGRVKADVDKTFFDILDDTSHVFGLMGALDVRYERLVFQLNGTWTTAEIEDEPARVPAGTLDTKLDIDSLWLELYAGYRLIDTPLDEAPLPKRRLTLDAFVGGRYTSLDNDFSLSTEVPIQLPDGSVLPPGVRRDIGASESWVEPFVGLRLDIGLTESINLGFRGDIGGFGAGSDFSWQAFGAIGYRWRFETWSLNLFGGYRALAQDYSDGGFTWNVITHGPMLGCSIEF